MSAGHNRVFVEQVCFESFMTFKTGQPINLNIVTLSRLLLFQNRPVSGNRLNTKQTIFLPVARPQRTIVPPNYHQLPLLTVRLEGRPTFTPNTPSSFVLSTSLIPLLHSSARNLQLQVQEEFRLSSVPLAESRSSLIFWPPQSFFLCYSSRHHHVAGRRTESTQLHRPRSVQ